MQLTLSIVKPLQVCHAGVPLCHGAAFPTFFGPLSEPTRQLDELTSINRVR